MKKSEMVKSLLQKLHKARWDWVFMKYEIIEYNGEEYVAMEWNGEYYGKCYKRAKFCKNFEDTFPADGWEHKDIALRPFYKEISEDEYELVGYEEEY